MHRKLNFWIIIILLMNTIAWSGEIKRCHVCGMDVSKYPHTKYVVTTTEGEEFFTCGVQCGLTLHLRLKEKFKSATATDLLSNRSVDAQKAFFIYKSTVITDMAPGFIAFCDQDECREISERFWGTSGLLSGSLRDMERPDEIDKFLFISILSFPCKWESRYRYYNKEMDSCFRRQGE